jgi:membrane fusion protein, multidrug efflux system
MNAAAALAWLGVTLFGFSWGSAPPPPDVRPVRTAVATLHPVGEPVSLTGHIRARAEESLAFRIDGKLIARRIDVGQAVKPGDVVAEIDPLPRQDSLHTAQARLVAAQAVLEEASKNLERQQKLVRHEATTWVQVDAAERTYRTAKAEVDATAAQLHSAEDQLGYTKLRADATGVVIATGAEAGEVVRAGQMIVTVAHQDGADAVFDVPASLMRRVSPDAEISIALSDDPAVHTVGRVREVAPQADPVTRSYRVKVGLTEWPAAMRLGATVTGRTHMRAPGGIELPATSLTSFNNRPAVWVVDPKNHQVSLQPIEVQRQDSEKIVVTRGLDGGELVVSAGVHALRTGQKVRLLGATQ